MNRLTLALRSLAASLALCACASTHTSLATTDGPWLAPSPQLQSKIDDAAARLPWTHGVERVELIHWFARIGEPAYAKLLELCQDPRPDVSGAALAALGATRDSRLVEHLRALPWPEEGETSDLSLERARTLLRLGDWSMVPRLIKGLRDERLVTRALCGQALEEATHERFDFDPRAEADVREQSVVRWEQWWSARAQDPLLHAPKPAGAKNDAAGAHEHATTDDT